MPGSSAALGAWKTLALPGMKSRSRARSSLILLILPTFIVTSSHFPELSRVLMEPGVTLSPEVVLGHLCQVALLHLGTGRRFGSSLHCSEEHLLCAVVFHTVLVKPQSFQTLRPRHPRSSFSFLPAIPSSSLGHQLTPPEPASP